MKILLDPSTIDVYSFPKSKEDMILHFNTAYVIPYDNLNTIKQNYNDILCQVSTGSQYVKRMLYTDSEVVVYKIYKALIINAITNPTNQQDLLDRSVRFNLQPIDSKNRKTESQLMKIFKEQLPYYLHDIFSIISYAKEIHETLEIDNLPRMSDAALWCCAIAEAAGLGAEKFLQLYEENQQEVNADIISDNMVAHVLILYMEDKDQWKGPVSKLWSKLKDVVELEGLDKNDPTWAKSPSRLSFQLNRVEMNLKKENIHFTIVHAGRCREITVYKK